MMGLAMASKEIDIGIPAFLLVDKKEAVRRRKWNQEHPLQPVSFSARQETRESPPDSLREQIEKDVKEEKKRTLNALHAHTKHKKEAAAQGAFLEPVKGTVWDAMSATFVDPNFMRPSKYARLMAEMPTEAHREALRRMYGTGAAPVVKARPVKKSPKANAKAAKPGKAKAKPAAAPATRAKRGGKPEQVAAVEAMLTRPEGASLKEIGEQFGWKEPSASAYISVNFRNLGRTTSKATVAGRGTVYRLDPEEKK